MASRFIVADKLTISVENVREAKVIFNLDHVVTVSPFPKRPDCSVVKMTNSEVLIVKMAFDVLARAFGSSDENPQD